MSLQFRNDKKGARALLSAPLLILASVLIFFGCNGAPTDPSAPTTDYTTQSYIVRDLNLNSSFVRSSFLRADTTILSGSVTYDSSVINPVNSIFQQVFSSANAIASGSHELSLMDTNTVISNLTIIMPDTIGFLFADSAVPYTGAGNLVLQFAPASSNATGFIVATVKASEVYAGVGYAEFVVGSSLANIPPSAFRDPITNALDTGLYYLFVYAYTGAPRLDLITTDLPTALPDTGFGPNIAEDLLSGNSGALLISARDSVFVQQL